MTGPSGTPKFDLICLGEAMGEFNAARSTDGRYLFGHGGDTSNCAIAAARQGAATAYVTAIGDDSAGRSLLDLWEAENVSSALVKIHPCAPTGLYFVEHGETGHRFSYMRKGSAASLCGPDDLPLGALGSARIVHASGISQAISVSACDAVFAAFETARSAGVMTAYDTNLRLGLWPLPRARAIIMAACAMADIVLPGHDDAALLTGHTDPDAIVDVFLALGARIVALTLGREGALVATPDKRQRIPGMAVDALDATGAGDAYDGAFLAEFIRSGDPFRAAAYANVAAALSTRGFGAVAAIPRRAEVEAALAASMKGAS